MEVRQIVGTIPVVGTPLTILTIHFATVFRAWDPCVVIIEVPIRLLAGRCVVHQALILAAAHMDEQQHSSACPNGVTNSAKFPSVLAADIRANLHPHEI